MSKYFDKYIKDGYTIYRNMFSVSEIDNWRSIIENEEKSFYENDKQYDSFDLDRSFFSHLVYNKDFLNRIILHPNVVGAVKELLGQNICFYGDASLNRRLGKNFGKTGKFHVDSKNDDNDPATTDYKIVRVGIYLNDIRNFSGGLKIRIGSHKQLCLKNGLKSFIYQLRKLKKGLRTIGSFKMGSMANFDMTPGDVGIWNLRLHHCGNSKRNKILPNLTLHPWLDRNLPSSFFLPLQKRRMVVFFQFGVNSPELVSYLKNRLSDGKRNFTFYEHVGLSFEETKKLFAERGVELFDIDKFYKEHLSM